MTNNKEMLFNQYKVYSDEELKEITVANGYTEEAEQIARQILGGDRTEYKEYIKQQEEMHKKEYDNMSSENTIGGILKGIGILILIIGTIASIIIAGGDGYRYEFSFVRFIIPEIISIISGMMFLGFAEIIQLLQDIKDKMK